MRTVYERCAGADVHKRRVVVCRRYPGPDGTRHSEVRTFGTTTSELEALAEWLLEVGCTHFAMESTGVYWRPVFNVVESVSEVVLVNAHHVKVVPGRKTDVRDCEWLADLLEHGLLRSSFIPPQAFRELRDLTRYRKVLIQARASEANRIQKVLETANIKLSNVATDVLGASGRAMLKALVSGERDAGVLSELAKGTLRNKREDLAQALRGRFSEHHGFLVGQILAHVEELDRHVAECDRRIEECLRPFVVELSLVRTITGVGERNGQVLLAEAGVDMTRFPSASHLASWVGICPGNNESAGKHKSGRTRKGNLWCKQALVEAAWCASRQRDTYMATLFRRIARRRGPKRAILAVAHSITIAVWHVLTKREPYRELGADYFDRLDRSKLIRIHLQALRRLGVTVAQPAA
jgi:transposase